ncbi:UNVERIFIED_ORG: hypothetical protein Xoosp15_203 [Xanthomonas phage Xoo-sp15]
MEIAITLFVVMVVSGGVMLYYSDCTDWIGFIGLILSVFGGIFLFIAILMTLGNRHDSAQFISQYHVLEETIKYNRDKGMSELERLELNKKIVEYNETLAKYKYANDGHFFDVTVVDEVSKLEYLR